MTLIAEDLVSNAAFVCKEGFGKASKGCDSFRRTAGSERNASIRGSSAPLLLSIEEETVFHEL